MSEDRSSPQNQDEEVRQAETVWASSSWHEEPEAGSSNRRAQTGAPEKRKVTMRYSNNKQKLGVRRSPRGYIRRKRVIAPYGRELHVQGVK